MTYNTYDRHAFFSAIDSNGDDSIDFSELLEYIYPKESADTEDTEQDEENRLDVNAPVLKSSMDRFNTI